MPPSPPQPRNAFTSFAASDFSSPAGLVYGSHQTPATMTPSFQLSTQRTTSSHSSSAESLDGDNEDKDQLMADRTITEQDRTIQCMNLGNSSQTEFSPNEPSFPRSPTSSTQARSEPQPLSPTPISSASCTDNEMLRRSTHATLHHAGILPPPPRNRPTPLTFNDSLQVNRSLHLSPSAPNLRLSTSTTSVPTPPPSWAPTPPPPCKSKGRNAKGLSLSLGFGNSSPSNSSSLSGGPSSTNGLLHKKDQLVTTRPNLRPRLLTSLPPPTPSSSAFQTSFDQQSTPFPPQNPTLVSLLPSYERDPTDSMGSSSFDAGPYAQGPVEIIPGLYIGSEENARDWKHLTETCHIGRVVNVAKELVSGAGLGSVGEVLEVERVVGGTSTTVGPVGSKGNAYLNVGGPPVLKSAISTPNLREVGGDGSDKPVVVEKTYSLPNGKKLEYLHLPWSHGQADLVQGQEAGFSKAGEFINAGMSQGESVLVHCQCGISRSATLVIAIVMRFAAEGKMPEILSGVRGMHDAYEFVKGKSPIIGPNVSLIYQLLEWERLLASETCHLPHNLVPPSTTSSTFPTGASVMSRGFSTDSVESEEDWSRRRAELEAQEEAEMMDREMEVRIAAEREKSGRGGKAQQQQPLSNGTPIALGGGEGGNSVVSRIGIKRRISGSSLASEITFEEEEGADEDFQDTRSLDVESSQPAPMVIVSSSPSSDRIHTKLEPYHSLTQPTPRRRSQGKKEGSETGHQSSASPLTSLPMVPATCSSSSSSTSSPTSSSTSASPTGSIGRSRKRSATLTFTPSLDPLPSSPPATITTTNTMTDVLQSTQPNQDSSIVSSKEGDEEHTSVAESMADLQLRDSGFIKLDRPRARKSFGSFISPSTSPTPRTVESDESPDLSSQSPMAFSLTIPSPSINGRSVSPTSSSQPSNASSPSISPWSSISRATTLLPSSENITPLPPTSLRELFFYPTTYPTTRSLGPSGRSSISSTNPSSLSIDPSVPRNDDQPGKGIPTVDIIMHAQQSSINTSDDETPQATSISRFSNNSINLPGPDPSTSSLTLSKPSSRTPSRIPTSTNTLSANSSFKTLGSVHTILNHPSNQSLESMKSPLTPGAFGTHQSPIQRRQAHRRAFSVDVLTLGSNSPLNASSSGSGGGDGGGGGRGGGGKQTRPIRSSRLAQADDGSILPFAGDDGLQDGLRTGDDRSKGEEENVDEEKVTGNRMRDINRPRGASIGSMAMLDHSKIHHGDGGGVGLDRSRMMTSRIVTEGRGGGISPLLALDQQHRSQPQQRQRQQQRQQRSKMLEDDGTSSSSSSSTDAAAAAAAVPAKEKERGMLSSTFSFGRKREGS